MTPADKDAWAKATLAEAWVLELNDELAQQWGVSLIEEHLRKKAAEHKWFVCQGNHDDGGVSCQFCSGDLNWCTVCDGFEGTLTTECCGAKLYPDTLDVDIYLRGLDFHHGHWHYPEEIREPRDMTLPNVYTTKKITREGK